MRYLLLALLCASTCAFAKGPDIDKVNGSIRTESGKSYGNLETVNGAVSVEADVEAEEVSTVNGSISIEERAKVGKAETVNGAISLRSGAVVEHDVETVNGSITLKQGARVGGGLETVNGGLRMHGAEVGGDLRTVNGSILVGEASIVHGGIHVEKPKGWFNWGASKPPRVTIGKDAVVEGTLNFEQEVELSVHPSAKIGKLTGVTPIKIDDLGVEK